MYLVKYLQVKFDPNWAVGKIVLIRMFLSHKKSPTIFLLLKNNDEKLQIYRDL